MLKEFNINTYTKNNNCYISTELSNLLNYVDTIGYRYSNNVRIQSSSIIEHYKILNEEPNSNNFFGFVTKQLSRYTNCYIKNNIYTKYICNNILSNGLMAVPIKSISQIPVETVYDFTTIHKNHSFVASSFVTHNCVETPEGAKIGIVKSLAMMSSISSQNDAQYFRCK